MLPFLCRKRTNEYCASIKYDAIISMFETNITE